MADTSVRPSDLRLLLRELPVLTGSAPTTAADNFPAGPVEAFSTWLHEAVRLGVPEPHAMTLATTAADGGPDTRVLLLKDVDERGWHFAIDADSPQRQTTAGNTPGCPELLLAFPHAPGTRARPRPAAARSGSRRRFPRPA